MPRVAYNRPLSKVGFRLMGATQPAYAAALSGLGSLGDDSSTLANYGFTAAEISQIIAAHQACSLSDQGYQLLLSGTVDPSQLSAFLDADLGCPTDASTPAAGSAAAGGAPTGSTIAYQGVWTTSNQANARTPTDIFAALGAQLPAYGLSLVSEQVVGGGLSLSLPYVTATDKDFTANITLRVTGSGFAQPQDAASIVEHLVYQITGNMPQQGASASVGTTSGATGATDLATFLENNMTTILFGLAAILVLPQLAKKL